MTHFIEINTGAFYRNVAVVGTFEVVNDGTFTAWKDSGVRRNGNSGAGHVKVLGLNTYNDKAVKVTVAGADTGYTVYTAEEMVALYTNLWFDAPAEGTVAVEEVAVEVEADVAVEEVDPEAEKLVALQAAFAAATGAERARLRKQAQRLAAKLAKVA
jgi:hypothetical protein